MISRLHISIIALIVALLPVLTSCGAFNEPEHPCPEPETPGKGIGLEFRVHTTAETLSAGRAASRADANGHPEEGSDNAQIEDYICPSDYGMFVFAEHDATNQETDATEHHRHLLVAVTSATEKNPDGFSMTGSFGDYTITLTLSDYLVGQMLGNNGEFSPLSPSGTRQLKLTVVMLANIGGSSTSHSNYEMFNGLKAAINTEKLTDASSLEDFMAIAKNLEYTGSNSASQIHIPMYGIRSFTLEEKDLFASRPDSRIDMGDISMLRAMMKIRILDNIVANKDANGYPKITKADFTYNYVRGFVTPTDPQNYVNGTQVHVDRMPSQIGYPAQTVPLRPGTIKENSLVACAPVQSLGSDWPTATVWVQRDAASEPQAFEVPINNDRFPGLTDTGKWGGTMLRNHVYTLNVVSVDFGAQLIITATVADWDDESFTFDYSDDVSTIGETGKITWSDGTYGGISDNGSGESSISMLPWHDGKTVPAVCQFGLATPVGALWTANLIVESGSADAFYFCDKDGNALTDADGNVLTSVEGRIDGLLAQLRIATRYPEPAAANQVRLQIVVVTQAGQGYTVATDGKILNRWHLIQNP